jgi:hypothetical protein
MNDKRLVDRTYMHFFSLISFFIVWILGIIIIGILPLLLLNIKNQFFGIIIFGISFVLTPSFYYYFIRKNITKKTQNFILSINKDDFNLNFYENYFSTYGKQSTSFLIPWISLGHIVDCEVIRDYSQIRKFKFENNSISFKVMFFIKYEFDKLSEDDISKIKEILNGKNINYLE